LKIIYITGCLGFIGSAFTKRCLDLGWFVHGIDKETYAANIHLLSQLNEYKNFKYEKADIQKLKFIEDCDFFINFAAESHVQNSIFSSDQFIESNILGVKNLLNLIKSKPKNSVDRPTFIQISTDEVYGDLDKGYHTETDLLKPSNPYSASKASADLLIKAWSRTYGIDYLIVRPTNNYGLNQFPEKLIPLTVKNLLREKKIKLHDKGEPIRNWLHVEDTVDALLTLIEKGEKNQIYNVSGSFEQKNIDTVKKIIDAFFQRNTNYKKYIDINFHREGQDVRYAIDDKKLRKLNWLPKKIFDKEIDIIVKSYKQNSRW